MGFHESTYTAIVVWPSKWSKISILNTWTLIYLNGHWYHLQGQYDNVGGQRQTMAFHEITHTAIVGWPSKWTEKSISGTWALNKLYGYWYHLRSQFDNVDGQRIIWDDWHGHSELAV